MKKLRISTTLTTLIFAILLSLLSVNFVQAKSGNPAKLSAKDFIYTRDGKKINFFNTSKEYDWAYHFNWWASDPAFEPDGGDEKTNRNIEVGKSTVSFVKKKYGETKKVKVSNKDRFYKIVNNNYDDPNVDTSTWYSYMEYTYKKGSDSYKVRFYIDKKNKVMAYALLKNPQSMPNYSDKQTNAKVTFLTSAGDKVKTQTINGKKVYILPDGAKLSYKESNRSEEKGAIYIEIRQWGKDGKLLAKSNMGPENFSQFQLKQGEYDAKKLLKSTHDINSEKYDDYLYFTIQLYSPNGDLSDKYGPKYYYFKFE